MHEMKDTHFIVKNLGRFSDTGCLLFELLFQLGGDQLNHKENTR
jgi:hypothetical protein